MLSFPNLLEMGVGGHVKDMMPEGLGSWVSRSWRDENLDLPENVTMFSGTETEYQNWI